MEVSSHSISLNRITALDFDIGAFTNLTQDHLDFHITMEEYAKAKQDFFTGLKETAVAVTNADDEFGAYMVSHTLANAHSYGTSDGSPFGPADIVASSIQCSLQGTSFEVHKRYSEEKTSFECKLVGSFNAQNLLAAASALYFGVEGFSLEYLHEAIANIRPVRGRFEQLELPNGAIAIIDYAHTPDALENVLATIGALKTSGKIITVFGCGGDRDKIKRSMMGEIAAKLSDKVIVTSDNPRTEDPVTIINDILAGIPRDKFSSVEISQDRKEAIIRALDASSSDDVILIAGKGHEDYQILGKEKIHFDDKEVVTDWSRRKV
jgi:UDP-N-acetylmuramoyl-L-alanyl-D-glutamate--2,6-diaminopimelate ligase